jgi:hypothetical protein
MNLPRFQLLLAALAITGAAQAQSMLHAGTLQMRTTPHPFRFSFVMNGKQIVAQDATAGILIGSEAASQAGPARCAAEQCSFSLSTPGGHTAQLNVSLTPHRASLRLTLPAAGTEVRFQTAGAAPAFGLADQIAIRPPYNTDVTGFQNDHFLSGEGRARLMSNFVLYPQQGFGELLIDPTTKIIHTSSEQIVQGVVQAGTTVILEYFFGTPREIYHEYRQARIDAGYP